jgi:hypothetical protein
MTPIWTLIAAAAVMFFVIIGCCAAREPVKVNSAIVRGPIYKVQYIRAKG